MPESLNFQITRSSIALGEISQAALSRKQRSAVTWKACLRRILPRGSTTLLSDFIPSTTLVRTRRGSWNCRLQILKVAGHLSQRQLLTTSTTWTLRRRLHWSYRSEKSLVVGRAALQHSLLVTIFSPFHSPTSIYLAGYRSSDFATLRRLRRTISPSTGIYLVFVRHGSV